MLFFVAFLVLLKFPYSLLWMFREIISLYLIVWLPQL